MYKVLKDYKVAFEVYNPILVLKKDEVLDLPANRAKVLLERNIIVAQEKAKEEEKDVVEKETKKIAKEAKPKDNKGNVNAENKKIDINYKGDEK